MSNTPVHYRIPLGFLEHFVTKTEFDYAVRFHGGVLPFVLALEAASLNLPFQRSEEAIQNCAATPNINFEQATKKVFELFVPTFKDWFVQRWNLSKTPINGAVLDSNGAEASLLISY